MDDFLGKYKLLKWSEETEKLDNPVADGEIEKVVKKIHPWKDQMFYKTLTDNSCYTSFPEERKNAGRYSVKLALTLTTKRIAQEKKTIGPSHHRIVKSQIKY